MGIFPLFVGVASTLLPLIVMGQTLVPGTIDSGFKPQVVGVKAIAIQSDGKIVVAGDFASVTNTRGHVSRLNADGTSDTTFQPVTDASHVIYAVAIQQDGKVVVGGSFTNIGGIARGRLARLNTDGSIDESFGGSGANDAVLAVAHQRDGKIVAVGGFTQFNGARKNRIVRLLADGSVDTNFVGSVSAFNAFCVAMQPDDHILIGGDFTYGLGKYLVMRTLPNGFIDQTFTPAFRSPGRVYSMALQKDGKIIVAGDFSSFGSPSLNRLARLNPDGTFDTNYVVSVTGGSLLTALAVQSNGKLVVAGEFTNIKGVRRSGLARLNADGTLDAAFNPAIAPPWTIAMQSDGDILVGGTKGLLRITGDPVMRTPAEIRLFDWRINESGEFSFAVRGEAALRYQIESSGNLIDWFPFAIVSLTNTVVTITDNAVKNNARRFFRLSMP